jgi:undecaprenyl pyrophosphate phosphatase UppP
MKIIKVEDWEQNHINGLTLDLILYATIATLVATLIAFLAHKTDMPEIKELLFAPWSVALVVGTAIAFHRGVLAERARAAALKEQK